MITITFAAAAAAPVLQRGLRDRAAQLLALVPLGCAAFVWSHLPLGADSVPQQAWSWVPALGVDLAFRLDGLSATFALLITGIGTLILLYASGYMHGAAGAGRLNGLLLLFMGAMLGVVLADELFTLFVFWELTSVSSYLLIGFKHQKAEVRDAARQALLTTVAGGLALLAGFVLLTLAAIQAGVPVDQASRVSVLVQTDLNGSMAQVAAVLIIIGALAKSAQMPLHYWLPNAMAAPTPVSAYLHSATMVKAGIYLLARLNPLFGDTVVWHAILIPIGALTMVFAAIIAAGQTDLKRILAYTTISVLGTLTMLIGVGTDLAIKAAAVYLVAHACYKAALFMIAGSIDHATGTRDVRQLSGLLRAMPLTAVAGGLAAFSMAGAPPLFGFIGKELLLKAKLDLEWLGVVLILVATVANIFLIAMALIAAVWPFFGKRLPTPKEPHEAPWPMLVGPLVLAGAGLFVGLIPGVFDEYLGTALVSAIGGRAIEMKLKLWHGFSPVALTALGISIVTLAAGLWLFAKLRLRLNQSESLAARLHRISPARGYQVLLDTLYVVAERVTAFLQTGSLRQYVLSVLLVLIALSAFPLLRAFAAAPGMGLRPAWYEIILVALVLVGAFAAVTSRSRLAAIAMLGVSGLLIAVLFAVYSAPDLALTQIMVETLTVILLVLIFYRLPSFSRLRSRAVRARDALIAGAGGAVMAGLLLASAGVQLDAAVSDALAQLSKPEGYGRNVVNVILVDFRALDTLGEITVVALAGLGVYALLKLRRRRPGAEGPA
jgi:multicomponent Na+:H+ antiporter subunit A